MGSHIIQPHAVGIIGSGFWGEKLLLTCRAMGIPVIITDMDPKRRSYIKHTYPEIQVALRSTDIFHNAAVSACIIATPPLTHYQLAKRAMLNHKHVLVEKPITLHPDEAKRLISIAAKQACVLMVDHIYLFSPVVHAAKKILSRNTIGTIQNITCERGTGRIHPGSSALWDLAPHDISIASFLLNADPKKGRIMTQSHGTIQDATYQLFYPKGIVLQGHVSWVTPIKTRHMEIIGESGAITIQWNEGIETLTLYKRNTTKNLPMYIKQKQYALKPKEEPMKLMLKHFLTCISRHQTPITDGAHGYTIIAAIDALHRSSLHHGTPIRL